jgi:hypothetical protein
MIRRRSRLVFIALAVCAATFYFSCTQPQDIMTPISRTDIYLGGVNEPGSNAALQVQNLPTNPEGMIYELWVANDRDTVSLGKFGYNQTSLTFRDENGDERPDSTYFVLEGDIFDFSHIFVSVETNPDTLPEEPGPIMLIDIVTEPSSDLIELRFPLNDSLTTTTVAFNMETPSDTSRDILGRFGVSDITDGFGVWFSVYQEVVDSVRDTLSLDDFTLVTKQDSTLEPDTFTTYLTDIVNDTAYDTARIFGLDTMLNTIVRFDSVLETDTIWPYTVMDMSDTGTVFYYTVGDSLKTFHYDNFLQFDYGLPDYPAYDSAYGWKYKGWIVSPEVPVNAVGQITKPAYSINFNSSDSLIPGVEGGLLTTGTFTDIAAPDEVNPFTIGDQGRQRVPPFPGEDFLRMLPFDMSNWRGLVPEVYGNSGTVFITLEPVNFVTDTTNFPLFVLIAPIPKAQANLIDFEYVLEQFTMKTMTNTNDASRGFPKIVVDIRRF